MKRWTWVALVALFALLAVGYSLVARRHEDVSEDSGEPELGVEPYESQEMSDATYGEPEDTVIDADSPSDAGTETATEASSTASGAASGSRGNVETVDDADEQGVTTQAPVVIDDEDTDVEVALPTDAPATEPDSKP